MIILLIISFFLIRFLVKRIKETVEDNAIRNNHIEELFSEHNKWLDENEKIINDIKRKYSEVHKRLYSMFPSMIEKEAKEQSKELYLKYGIKVPHEKLMQCHCEKKSLI